MVSFNNLTIDRIPFAKLEIDNSLANLNGEQPFRVLLLGRSANPITDRQPMRIVDKAEARSVFGETSPVYKMANQFLGINRATPLYALPFSDDEANTIEADGAPESQVPSFQKRLAVLKSSEQFNIVISEWNDPARLRVLGRFYEQLGTADLAREGIVFCVLYGDQLSTFTSFDSAIPINFKFLSILASPTLTTKVTTSTRDIKSATISLKPGVEPEARAYQFSIKTDTINVPVNFTWNERVYYKLFYTRLARIIRENAALNAALEFDVTDQRVVITSKNPAVDLAITGSDDMTFTKTDGQAAAANRPATADSVTIALKAAPTQKSYTISIILDAAPAISLNFSIFSTDKRTSLHFFIVEDVILKNRTLTDAFTFAASSSGILITPKTAVPLTLLEGDDDLVLKYSDEIAFEPFLLATSLAAVVAIEAQASPGRPFNGLKLANVPQYSREMAFSRDDYNTLVDEGFSVYSLNGDGEPVIERLVTTYTKDSTGAPDDSFQSVNDFFVSSRIRFRFVSYFWKKYISQRYMIANDDDPIPAGQPILQPKFAKAEAVTVFEQWQEEGLVKNAKVFQDSLIVEYKKKGVLEFAFKTTFIDQLIGIAGKLFLVRG